MSCANPAFNLYRTFCRAEDIPLFPIVASVVATWLYECDRRITSILSFSSYLEKARTVTQHLWSGSDGAANLDEGLSQDRDVAFVRLSTDEGSTQGTVVLSVSIAGWSGHHLTHSKYGYAFPSTEGDASDGEP